MQRSSHRRTSAVTTLAIIGTLALLPSVALGEGSAVGFHPSAIERLVLQEDARRAELARFAAIGGDDALPAMLDARERAMVANASAATRAPLDTATRSGAGGEFAWGAAALGLAAGVAAMCVLLGCGTLIRSPGRLRGV